MPALVVNMLLFGLPLLVFPFGLSFFESPKVIVAQALALLLIMFQLYKAGYAQSFQRIPLYLYALLIFLSAAGFIYNPDLYALFGNPFRQQGAMLLWILIFFSYISSSIKLNQAQHKIAVATLATILVLAIVFGPEENSRYFSTLGEPNSMAASALFLWPLTLMWPGKKLKFVALSLALLLVLLSGSRSALLGLSLQLILLIPNIQSFFKQKLILAVFLLASSMVLPFVEGEGWFENRAEIWKTAIRAGSESFLLGNGFGNLGHALKNESIKLNNNIQYQFIDSSHNILLDFWIQAGFAGLASLIAILALAYYYLVRKREFALAVSLTGLLASFMFNPLSIVCVFYLWWLLGQAFSRRS